MVSSMKSKRLTASPLTAEAIDIKTDQTAAELWFTFSGGQHASISWDPSTGYGDLGEASSTLNPLEIVGIVVGSIAAVGLVSFLFLKLRSARAKSSSQAPGLTGKSATSAGYGAI